MHKFRLGIFIFLLPWLLVGCTSKNKVEKGISFALAQQRKQVIKEIDYGLRLVVPEKQTDSITGTIKIYFLLIKDESKYLFLDFNESENKLQRIAINRKPSKLIFENEHVIVPTDMLITGYNEVIIDFIAGDRSLNRNADYLYTLFVPERASTCFPVFDQPDLKASYQLELSVPTDWEAVTNSSLGSSFEENGKKVYQFVLSQPISSYQFAFAAGKFKKILNTETGMTMYYRETDSVKVNANVKEIFSLHRQAIKWMEDYTDYKYPFLKFDFVLLPSFQYGGMEHPGNIFYRESSLILEPTASINQKLRRASLIAHETAHMWFGNLVTMKWFNDVWLKEVFANFMAAKIVNPQFPEINHDLRFLMAHYPTAYDIDRSEGSHPIQQELDNLKNAGTLYGGIIYQKAPIMMRNLEAWVGEENFRSGIKDYFIEYNFKNASWDDLISKLKNYTNKDIDSWSQSWIKTKGMPEVAYSFPSDQQVKITIANDSAGTSWPQSFQFQFARDGNTEIKDIEIGNGHDNIIAIENPTPVITIPNYRGKGYGYFNADEASIKNMVAQVNTQEDALVRAALWLNVWEYMLRGQLDPEEVFEALLAGAGKENDPLILEYITQKLKRVFWQFYTPQSRIANSMKTDTVLFNRMMKEKDTSLKRTLFNCFEQVALSENGIAILKKIWNDELTLGLELSEQDHIQLAYELALREVDGHEDILKTQLEKIENPDREEAMRFVMPSLAHDEATRDAFFEGLKNPQNREHEPWVLDALGYLHHPLRAQQAVKYLKPGLEMLEEIQLTGDIFFPAGWLNEMLAGHQSTEAAAVVRQFLKDNRTLSQNLKNKLLQSADMLFRAEQATTKSRNTLSP